MMKYRIAFFLFFMCMAASGQKQNFPGGSGGCITAVATLSSACGTTNGTLATVTDGNSATDCTVGGGTTVVACKYGPSAWASAGSSTTLPTATVKGQIPSSTGAGTTYAAQNKPLADEQDYSGATGCDIINALAAANPYQKVTAEALTGSIYNCANVDLNNPFNTIQLNGGNIFTTDVGWTWGNRQVVNGNVGNIGATAAVSGTQFRASANFPLGSTPGTLLATGTIGAGTVSLTKTGTAIQLAPYDILVFAGDSTIYYVKKCTAGTDPPCADTTAGGAGASDWYKLAGSTPLVLSSVANASGGVTVYTGTITGGAANALVGFSFLVTGFATGANNGGPWIVSASTATTLTLSNTAGVAETHAGTASQSITVNITPVLASSPSSAATTLTSAVIEFGDIQGGSPSGEKLESAFISCALANGNGIGVRDNYAQENSDARNVWINNCGRGFWVPSAANSGDWSNLNVGYTAEANCPSTTIPFETSGAHKKFSRVTITTQSCTAAKLTKGIFHITNAQIGGVSAPGGLVLEQFHGEAKGPSNSVDMILVDSANPSPAGNTGAVEIPGASGCPSANPCLNLLHVASNFAGTLNFHDSTCNGGTTNAVVDDINSNTMTCANNSVALGYYRLDAAVIAHTNLNCTDMTKGWCEYNGVFSYYSGGVVQISFTGATGAIVATNVTDSALAVDSIPYAGAGGILTAIPSPTVNGLYSPVWNVTGGVAVVPVSKLPGVPVDASNPATLLYSDRFNFINWTSGSAQAWPAVSGNFASNFGFSIKNTAGSTLTFTPNAGASDLCDGSATCTLLNNFAALVYQDGTTAPGHWFTLKMPTFAAFPACADSAGNHLNFTTAAGFTCGTTSGSTATITSLQGASLGTSNITGVTQNITRVWWIYVPTQITTTGICYNAGTADNTANVYDIGIYNSSGTLVVDTGATAGTTLFASSGTKCVSWQTGGGTLSAGDYALALTSSAAAPLAKFGGTSSGFPVKFATVSATGGTTSGGVLNGSITFPSTSWTTGETALWNIH